MTFAEYAALEGVNWSKLKAMRDSALAYRYGIDHPREDTMVLMLGRAVHTLVFEPDQFARDFAIYEGGTRRGKEWEAFAAFHEGKTIFKPDEIAPAYSMALAVKSHPLVRPYFAGAEFEQALQWTDAETGLPCKARVDWLVPRMRAHLELKSARSIEARRFGIAANFLGYHCQMAHHGNGVRCARGWVPEVRKIVAVESAPPHDIAVFDVSSDDIGIGADEVQMLLIKLKRCIDTQTWPGRYDAEQPLQLPAYIHGELEFEYE